MNHDIERLQEGDASAKYNSSLDVLRRINQLQEQCNYYSSVPGLRGCRDWQSVLGSLERELWGYMNAKEQETIARVRVSPVTFWWVKDRGVQANENKIRERLDVYERALRSFAVRRGFQIVAEENKGSIILGGGK